MGLTRFGSVGIGFWGVGASNNSISSVEGSSFLASCELVSMGSNTRCCGWGISLGTTSIRFVINCNDGKFCVGTSEDCGT